MYYTVENRTCYWHENNGWEAGTPEKFDSLASAVSAMNTAKGEAKEHQFNDKFQSTIAVNLYTGTHVAVLHNIAETN